MDVPHENNPAIFMVNYEVRRENNFGQMNWYPRLAQGISPASRTPRVQEGRRSTFTRKYFMPVMLAAILLVLVLLIVIISWKAITSANTTAISTTSTTAVAAAVSPPEITAADDASTIAITAAADITPYEGSGQACVEVL